MCTCTKTPKDACSNELHVLAKAMHGFAGYYIALQSSFSFRGGQKIFQNHFSIPWFRLREQPSDGTYLRMYVIVFEEVEEE